MATHSFLYCLDPPELVSEVKKIGWLRFFQPISLIHLPGKLAGVFLSRAFWLVAVNLVHLPDPSGARLVGVRPLSNYASLSTAG